MGFKNNRLRKSAVAAVVGITALSFLSGPTAGEQGQLWQLALKLQVRSDFRATLTQETSGGYVLEINWSGFLEEDGLDFIIYHLGSAPARWEFVAPAGQGPVPFVPAPAFRLDYVEGKEEEINFYYSFNPEVISFSENSSSSRVGLVLPALPWPRSSEKIPWLERKLISGVRNLSLLRNQLSQTEVRKEFSWEEETRLRQAGSVPISQRSRVRITLELIKCKSRTGLRPGDGNGHKSASACPG